jgi:hypothetical protein
VATATAAEPPAAPAAAATAPTSAAADDDDDAFGDVEDAGDDTFGDAEFGDAEGDDAGDDAAFGEALAEELSVSVDSAADVVAALDAAKAAQVIAQAAEPAAAPRAAQGAGQEAEPEAAAEAAAAAPPDYSHLNNGGYMPPPARCRAVGEGPGPVKRGDPALWTDHDTPEMQWFEGDGSAFQVRKGPNYRRNKQKDHSGPCLFQLVDVQLHHVEQKLEHVCAFLPLPEVGEDFLFVVHAALPNYPPSFYGQADGNGLSLIMYYVIPKEVLEATKADEPAEPWAIVLKRFLEAPLEDVDAETKAIHERLKFIALIRNLVADGGDVDLGSLSKWNGKPVLSRPQHAFHRGDGYFEVDIDVHMFG